MALKKLQMEHITAKSLKTALWQGGTTTELYIFPKDSVYKERNFLFRVSTATIEAPDSTFTTLPGIQRKIMILEGKITLTHADRYSKTLRKFETDSFMGDWDTQSVGMATDFNLMTTGNIEGEISGVTCKKGEHKELKTNPKTEWVLIYCFSGSLEVSGTIVGEKDIIVLRGKTEIQSIKLNSLCNCEVAVVELWGIEIE